MAEEAAELRWYADESRVTGSEYSHYMNGDPIIIPEIPKPYQHPTENVVILYPGVSTFLSNNFVYIDGTLRVTSGTLLVITGTAASGISAGSSVILIGLGADNIQTGSRQIITGEYKKSLVNQGVIIVAVNLGADEKSAELIGYAGDATVNIIVPVGASMRVVSLAGKAQSATRFVSFGQDSVAGSEALIAATESGVAPKAGIRLATGMGSGAQSMTVVRTIGKGERIADLINEVKILTYTTGNEQAVVTLADGTRAIVCGGEEGIFFAEGQVTRIFGHTHPYQRSPTGPSNADFTALKLLDQRSSYVLEHGRLIRFSRGN